jgi:hypothetical protein
MMGGNMVSQVLTSNEAIEAAGKSAAFFLCSDSAERFGRSQRGEAAHRLVKGSKSRTRPNLRIDGAIFQHLSPRCTLPNLPVTTDKAPDFARDCRGAGRYTVIGFREWSDEYRIRTEVHATQKQQPPENTGDRVTEILSERGARKIAESCEFMGAQRGGYSTFLTLTLDEQARARVDSGETTIQREVSRFFNSLQKMYQRGFECVIDGKPHKFTGL